VFYRVNALSRLLEEAFVERSIPYAIYGGTRFYERREIKDLIAYLRVVANPADEEALARIVNVPPRGIGDKGFVRLREIARGQGLTTFDAMKEAQEGGLLKGAAARGVREFCALVDGLQAESTGSDVAGLILSAMTGTGYREYLLRDPEGQDRLLNVQELISGARGQRDLAAYLQEKALLTSIDARPGTR
jgi:DNA helicase-2/ATP-dependent DNA helicase PcrA